jgi:5-methylcytosine-specific restriction endonuclease McrA
MRDPRKTYHYQRARLRFIARAEPSGAWHRCPVPGRVVDKTLSGNHQWGPTIDHGSAVALGLRNFWDDTNWFLIHRFCNDQTGQAPINAPSATRSSNVRAW